MESSGETRPAAPHVVVVASDGTPIGTGVVDGATGQLRSVPSRVAEKLFVSARVNGSKEYRKFPVMGYRVGRWLAVTPWIREGGIPLPRWWTVTHLPTGFIAIPSPEVFSHLSRELALEIAVEIDKWVDMENPAPEKSVRVGSIVQSVIKADRKRRALARQRRDERRWRRRDATS